MNLELRQIWDIRLAGDLASSRQRLASFIALRDLPTIKRFTHTEFESWVHVAEQTLKGEELSSTICLIASFARRDAGVADAAKILLSSHAIEATFFWQLQHGLNTLTSGDKLSAARSFSSAAKFAGNETDQAIARLNHLLALEELGAPLDELVRDAESILNLSIDEPSIRDACHEQLLAFKARAFFKRGAFASIHELATDKNLHGQALYFAAWTLSIPWINHLSSSTMQNSLSYRLSTTQHDYFMGEFHYGTITGHNGSRTPTTAKHVELVERIYLWVWRWIIDPSHAKAMSIRGLAADIAAMGTIHAGFDDFMLFNNAKDWFEQLTGEQLPHCDLRTPTHQPAICQELNEEARILAELKVVKGNRSDRVSIKNFIDSLKSRTSSEIASFLANLITSQSALTSFLFGDHFPPLHEAEHRIEVLQEFEMIRFHSNHDGMKTFQSLEASRLLPLLSSAHSITLDQVARVLWNADGFDALRHDSKLAKCLHKLNKELATIGRWQRRGQIVSFSPSNAATILTAKANPFSDHSTMRSASTGSTAKVASGKESAFDRGQIERLLGLKKTAAVGKVNELVLLGLLKKTGRGRTTTYIPTSDFLTKYCK